MPAPSDTVPHGGRLLAACARYPDAPRPFIDLSTGINPVPYPLPVLPTACFARLPEPEDLAALCVAAGSAYGISTNASIVAAPGTQILITVLPRLLPPTTAVVLGPTYTEHALAWTAAGHRVVETDDADRLAGAQVAVLCQPNNPDGRRHRRADLLALAASVGLLVVDEAFADFEPEHQSLVGALPQNALVFRSFGKSYGLAGLRLGFAVAAPPLARRIEAALGPWPVSGPAIAVGRLALADADWRTATAARLVADAVRLDAVLARSGRPLIGGTTLFRLYATSDARTDADTLARAGILIRTFCNDNGRVRLGFPGCPSAWARLEAALNQSA